MSRGGAHFGGGLGRGGFSGGWGRSYSGGRGYGRSWYPGFYGGFGYYSGWYPNYYGYGYYDYPAYNYDYPSYSYVPAYQPPVAIQQDLRYQTEAPPPPPPRRAYSERPNDATDFRPTLYLIAQKNRTILPALTYWVEKGVLHYVTMDHDMKELPLGLIDRDLSERLNRERNMSFHLPAS